MNTTRSVVRGAARLAYDEAGEATGVSTLFLHGATGDPHAHWDRVVRRLAGVRAILPYARGHGPSSAVAKDVRLTLDDLVADACAVLDDAGVARAHIVGFSMGGATALALAAKKPQRVDRLVVTGAGFLAAPDWVARARTLFADRQSKQGQAWRSWVEARHAPHHGPGYGDRLIAAFDDLWDDLGRHHPHWPQRLTRIEAPVLFTRARADAWSTDEEARLVSDTVAHATRQDVPGDDHLWHLARPDAFASLLAAHLGVPKATP